MRRKRSSVRNLSSILNNVCSVKRICLETTAGEDDLSDKEKQNGDQKNEDGNDGEQEQEGKEKKQEDEEEDGEDRKQEKDEDQEQEGEDQEQEDEDKEQENDSGEEQDDAYCVVSMRYMCLKTTMKVLYGSNTQNMLTVVT